MAEDRDSSGGLLGLAAVAVGVCCGLPLLLGAGLAVSATGLAVGSGAVLAAGILLPAWVWRRRRAHSCAADDAGEARR